LAFQFNDAFQVGAAGYMASGDYRRKTAEGGNPLQAGASAAGSGILALVSVPTAFALPLIPAAGRALLAYGYGESGRIRQRATPFSRRYEGSEMAGQMQSYAMGQMGQMSGAGNEAQAYMGRYGRG